MESFKSIATYGTWKSDIDVDSVTFASHTLGGVKVCNRTGSIFLLESRADGTAGILRLEISEGAKAVLPDEYGVKTSVHEYGGGAWTILASGDILFSNGADNSVYLLNVETGECSLVLGRSNCRYAEMVQHPVQHNWIIAIQEDHTKPDPSTVVTTLVAYNMEIHDFKVLLSGEDFYTKPKFSPDGKMLAWTHWNHPEMPWTGAMLSVAQWSQNGSLKDAELVAGGHDNAVSEPRWAPDGELHFLWEVEKYRKFHIWNPTDKKVSRGVAGPQDAEFGKNEWILGSNTYAFLNPTTLLASSTQNGEDKIIQIDLDTSKWHELDLPLNAIAIDSMAVLSSKSAIIIGKTRTSPSAVYKAMLSPTPALTKLRDSSTENFPPILYSKPEHITIPPTSSGPAAIPVHAFFYPPHNPKFTGPKDAKPPLLVFAHGGPTGTFDPGLDLYTQFWTSRGFAVLALNYRGSAGHGAPYREALNAHWGKYDVDDAAAAVKYLSDQGRIDGTRAGIRGGSAGGYCVLQAVVTYPDVFAGAVSAYGISDVKGLVEETHKFESHYLDRLFFEPGMGPEQREKVMAERSPVNHAHRIRTPLLLLQGGIDRVVPPEQAHKIEDAIKKRKGVVRLVMFPDEGHGWKKAENQKKSIEEEYEWWKKTLVRE